MNPQTDEVNTKTWLKATKSLKMSAYIEAYSATLTISQGPLRGEVSDEALEEAGPLYRGREVAIPKNELQKELEDWDDLSDEAWLNFENELV